MMLSSLEKLFPIILNIPDVNMRLTKIIEKPYENHPPCPQLYLYSSGDKVVPSHSGSKSNKRLEERYILSASGRLLMSTTTGTFLTCTPHSFTTSYKSASSKQSSSIKLCDFGT
ncbi:unnamed protein product [Brassica rapa subsp. narinosa]